MIFNKALGCILSVTLVSLHSHLKCVCVREEASELLYPHHAIKYHPVTQPVINIWGGSHSFHSSSPSLSLAFHQCGDICQTVFFAFFLAIVQASSCTPPQELATCKSVPLISLWRDCEWSGEVPCPSSSIPVHLRCLLLPSGWGAPQSGWTGFEFN